MLSLPAVPASTSFSFQGHPTPCHRIHTLTFQTVWPSQTFTSTEKALSEEHFYQLNCLPKAAICLILLEPQKHMVIHQSFPACLHSSQVVPNSITAMLQCGCCCESSRGHTYHGEPPLFHRDAGGRGDLNSKGKGTSAYQGRQSRDVPNPLDCYPDTGNWSGTFRLS